MDKSKSKLQYGCHCDLEEGMSPDGCVIDIGRTQDCVHAKKHTAKEQCKYWQPINFCAAPTSADSQEREAFERWCRSRGYNSLMRDKHGDYSHGVIQWRWDTWQARAALAAPKQPMSALTDEQIISAVNTVHTADIGGDYWLTPIGMVVVARAVLDAAQERKS